MSGDTVAGGAEAESRAGYFGKMPSRGDFLSFGLPRDFTDPWDDWLQVALHESRDRFAGQWLDIYLTSPLWNFCVGPAICGSGAWAGVLMPSVDAVGRYFPLTVAAPVEPTVNLFSLAGASPDWFAQIEELARSCLDDALDLDLFDRDIRRLPAPVGAPSPLRDATHAGDEAPLGNAWRYGMESMDQLAFDCPALLHDMVRRLLYSYSLWWTPGSMRVTPTYLLCQGLPPPQGFAAMLDGNWQKWGWDDRRFLMVGGRGDTAAAKD